MKSNCCKSILIVDDDQDIRDSIKSALEYEGFDVVVSYDGHHALRLLNEDDAHNKFGLIILDVMMPGMNGHEFLSEFQKMHNSSSIPIVMSSAIGSFNQESLAGVQRKLKKPFDLDELSLAVQELCNKKDNN